MPSEPKVGASFSCLLPTSEKVRAHARTVSYVIHPSAWKKFDSRKFEVATCASIAPLLWPQTSPRRNFFSISSTVATPVTRIRYKRLRLATVRSSENFLR